jgi:methionine biosynthesis protein MetW
MAEVPPAGWQVTRQPLVYDSLVAAGGLSEAHRLIIGAVPSGSRVLDAGCAGGYLAARLRDDKGCTVIGLDADPTAVAAARERGIEAALVDLDRADLPAAGFDVIVLADVLEHLVDPLRVLRSARPAARVIVSLPNIAHWSARRHLLFGRWPQEDHGLFDRTHLHCFTRSTARGLAVDAGFAVVREQHTTSGLPLERLGVPARWRRPAANRWPTLFALQYVLSLA